MKQKNLENRKIAAKLDIDTHLYLREQIGKFKSENAFLNNFMTEITRVHLADSVQPNSANMPRSDSDYNSNSEGQLSPASNQ